MSRTSGSFLDLFQIFKWVPRPVLDFWESPRFLPDSVRVPRHISNIQEGPPTRPRLPGESPYQFQTSGRVPRPIPELWECPPTRP